VSTSSTLVSILNKKKVHFKSNRISTETRLRSLEEMDEIFRKSTSIFDVVSVARDTPNRYGKSGELLINYLDTEAAHGARRRSSLIEPTYGKTKNDGERVERLEVGNGSSSGAS
jgi:hypothetical protein